MLAGSACLVDVLNQLAKQRQTHHAGYSRAAYEQGFAPLLCDYKVNGNIRTRFYKLHYQIALLA